VATVATYHLVGVACRAAALVAAGTETLALKGLGFPAAWPLLSRIRHALPQQLA